MQGVPTCNWYPGRVVVAKPSQQLDFTRERDRHFVVLYDRRKHNPYDYDGPYIQIEKIVSAFWLF